MKLTAERLFLTSLVLLGLCFPQDNQLEHDRIPDLKNGSCSFSGSGVVANCIVRGENENPLIAPDVVKQLRFDSHGLAQVRSEETKVHAWMYVDRKGRVVVSGVPNYDNWADDFSGGLVRIVINRKYGFANRQGKIVIKPAYDWASPFHGGYAEVCNGCQEKCALPGGAAAEREGCDHTYMAGGEWFKIDKNARVVARIKR